MKPLPHTVGLSHTPVNVSQGECGTQLCHKVEVEQPVTALSVLTGIPCSEPSSISALPAPGWDQGHYTPAKTSLSAPPLLSSP